VAAVVEGDAVEPGGFPASSASCWTRVCVNGSFDARPKIRSSPLRPVRSMYAARLRAAEDELERKRQGFREALQAAHRDGASLAQLGTLTGRSRQRIAQVLRGD
jgi:hypothetical protein